MIVVQIPDEFLDFCLQLHQDLLVVYGPDPQDWIDGALEQIPRQRRPALNAYIKHLLSGPYTGEELQAIWRSTDADWRCHDERSLRNFLKMICATIDRDAALS